MHQDGITTRGENTRSPRLTRTRFGHSSRPCMPVHLGGITTSRDFSMTGKQPAPNSTGGNTHAAAETVCVCLRSGAAKKGWSPNARGYTRCTSATDRCKSSRRKRTYFPWRSPTQGATTGSPQSQPETGFRSEQNRVQPTSTWARPGCVIDSENRDVEEAHVSVHADGVGSDDAAARQLHEAS